MDTQLKLPVKFIGVGLTVLLLVVVVSISLLSRRSDPKPTPSSKLNPTPTSIVPTLVYPTPVDYSSLSEQEKQASYLQRELIANEWIIKSKPHILG